jgi:GntR family transcriptional regulator, transcriptional repressor for pyruvate dehydrogenase complex
MHRPTVDGKQVRSRPRGAADATPEDMTGMKVPPIKTASLVERLAAEVRAQIISGKLAVGQPLPTEARMAEEFGVSRPLVREALAHLRAQGFVETISGRGTFVQHPSQSDLADAFAHQLVLAHGPGPTADDLYEARGAIELISAELAAQRATEDSIEALERLLSAMKESREDAAAYTAADVGFHVEVARATLNPLLPTLLAPLARLIVEGVFESYSTSDAVRLGIAGHTRVLQAIKRGDPGAARRAMAAHLHQSRQVFPERVVQQPRPGTDGSPA